MATTKVKPKLALKKIHGKGLMVLGGLFYFGGGGVR
jgi:hypothetical protein